jgi:hypothetical protein
MNSEMIIMIDMGYLLDNHCMTVEYVEDHILG